MEEHLRDLDHQANAFINKINEQRVLDATRAVEREAMEAAIAELEEARERQRYQTAAHDRWLEQASQPAPTSVSKQDDPVAFLQRLSDASNELRRELGIGA